MSKRYVSASAFDLNRLIELTDKTKVASAPSVPFHDDMDEAIRTCRASQQAVEKSQKALGYSLALLERTRK